MTKAKLKHQKIKVSGNALIDTMIWNITANNQCTLSINRGDKFDLYGRRSFIINIKSESSGIEITEDVDCLDSNSNFLYVQGLRYALIKAAKVYNTEVEKLGYV